VGIELPLSDVNLAWQKKLTLMGELCLVSSHGGSLKGLQGMNKSITGAKQSFRVFFSIFGDCIGV